MKLLDSYREIDAEDFKTEKMRKTKEDIGNSLDTMNDAFKKLLDRIFTNRAIDLSSDMTVLDSMIRKEGLNNDDFKTEK